MLLFEDNLMSEAQRLTNEGKFDDAFDYFGRLLRDYPARPGLNEAVNDYLLSNSSRVRATALAWSVMVW